MKCSPLTMRCVLSRAMHVLVLLMKLSALCVPMHVLMMLSVETVEVKLRHLKAVEKTERRISREMGTSSAVEGKHAVIVVVIKEAMRAENIVEVSTASRTIEGSLAKLVILSSFILVAQYLIRCSQKQLIRIHQWQTGSEVQGGAKIVPLVIAGQKRFNYTQDVCRIYQCQTNHHTGWWLGRSGSVVRHMNEVNLN